MITKDQKEWISMKYQEAARAFQRGNDISCWDLPKFLIIIKDLERDIRKLKTQLGQKSKV